MQISSLSSSDIFILLRSMSTRDSDLKEYARYFCLWSNLGVEKSEIFKAVVLQQKILLEMCLNIIKMGFGTQFISISILKLDLNTSFNLPGLQPLQTWNLLGGADPFDSPIDPDGQSTVSIKMP